MLCSKKEHVEIMVIILSILNLLLISKFALN